MSKIPTPEELRRTKQPYATEKLLHWAQEAGFEVGGKRSGSHYTCRHTEYHDIKFNIIANSKRTSSQADLSDALVELAKRNALKTQVQTSFQTNTNDTGEADDLCEEFQKVSRKTYRAIKRELPPYIAAEYDTKNGVVVLRDRNVPQIGVTLQPEETRLIENKVKQLEDIKRDAFALLHRCRTQYDIDVGDLRNGNFEGTLKHAVYQMPEIAIGDYQSGDDPGRFSHELRAYIAAVETKDLEHQVKMEDLLGHDFIRDWQITFHTRRGERSVVVVCDTPNREALKLTFSETSNQRCKAHDITSGRMKEDELALMDKVISGIAAAHEQRIPAVA